MKVILKGLQKRTKICHAGAGGSGCNTYIVACVSSFYTMWSKRSFVLCGQWFPRYKRIFKICLSGHEIWKLQKFKKLYMNLFPLKGSKYFHSTGGSF